MHGDLGNFFKGTFSFDFQFKDLLNQTGEDWTDPNIPGLIITETSDHMKLCVTGHTSNADKINIEPTFQGLWPFLKSNELHVSHERVMSNDNPKQGVTRINRNAPGCDASIDVNIEIVIASLCISLQPNFDFLDFADCGWAPFSIAIPPAGQDMDVCHLWGSFTAWLETSMTTLSQLLAHHVSNAPDSLTVFAQNNQTARAFLELMDKLQTVLIQDVAALIVFDENQPGHLLFDLELF